jgi:hypothetical protein
MWVSYNTLTINIIHTIYFQNIYVHKKIIYIYIIFLIHSRYATLSTFQDFHFYEFEYIPPINIEFIETKTIKSVFLVTKKIKLIL